MNEFYVIVIRLETGTVKLIANTKGYYQMSDDRRYDGDFREVTEDFNEPEEIEIIMESGDESAGGSSADEQADGSGDSPEEKEKDAPDEKYCVICHRSSRKAGKLVDIPGGMCVCTDCLQKRGL